MRRVLLVVLDGLGVGALEDVSRTRPQDLGADSLAHALERAPAQLPFLSSLGLGCAARSASLSDAELPLASWGQSELGYPGADSFLGHQVLMGADVKEIRLEVFASQASLVQRSLRDHGHGARWINGWPALLVDGAILVADSLEADPGMNYNVTGSLDATTFEAIRAVAEVVREAAVVPRVIAVGAQSTPIELIVDSVEERGGAVGIDIPSLGIYERGAEIVHLGTRSLEIERQLPTMAAAAGMSVTLIGKMADVVFCEMARRLPAVRTAEVLDFLQQAVEQQGTGLIAANVQELDLAGHSQNPADYVAVLEQCDIALAGVVEKMEPRDLLLVTGDHGNDPTLGAMHTRERVPVLAYGPHLEPTRLGTRATLADVGATACAWLGLTAPAMGTSFLDDGRG